MMPAKTANKTMRILSIIRSNLFWNWIYPTWTARVAANDATYAQIQATTQTVTLKRHHRVLGARGIKTTTRAQQGAKDQTVQFDERD
jgi:hypothetical protein